MIDAVSGVISRKPLVLTNPEVVDMSNSDSLDVSSGSTGYAGMMRGTSSAADTSVVSASSGLTDIRAATIGVIGAALADNMTKPSVETKPTTNPSELSLFSASYSTKPSQSRPVSLPPRKRTDDELKDSELETATKRSNAGSDSIDVRPERPISDRSDRC